MSVIDLSYRLTDDYGDYERHTKSTDSLIYIDPIVKLEDGPASCDLTVGDGWFNCSDNRYYAIPDGGITLRPHKSIVIETQQTIGVPLTAFGLVIGKGKFIFQGILISSGKVDPGFYGQLRIGIYNGGNEDVILGRGEPFCVCSFFGIDTNFGMVRRRDSIGPSTILPSLPMRLRVSDFFKRNWGKILTILIALASLVISILK